MEYECQAIPINKVPLNIRGFAEPICNSCTTSDCTNPITERTVSVFGLPKKVKLYVVNTLVKQVITCKGYSGNVSMPLDDME